MRVCVSTQMLFLWPKKQQRDSRNATVCERASGDGGEQSDLRGQTSFCAIKVKGNLEQKPHRFIVDKLHFRWLATPLENIHFAIHDGLDRVSLVRAHETVHVTFENAHLVCTQIWLVPN